MLTKPTDSSNFLFETSMAWIRGLYRRSWSENTENIFVVFRENTVKAKVIVLWRNKDVLLDVGLFHARTWAFAFP